MMKPRHNYLLVLMLLIVTNVSAQEFISSQQIKGDVMLGRDLFPAEMVIRQASEIGLTENQKDAIKEVIRETDSRTLDVKWDLRDEAEKMRKMLEPASVDEQAVIKQANIVMTLEKEMKVMQLSMLIRIKNILTEEQVKQLRQFISKRAKSIHNLWAVPGVRVQQGGYRKID